MSATPLSFSAQEILVIIVVGEVILGAAVSAQRSAVRELLQVVQAAGDAPVAVAVEGVEGNRRPSDDAGVQLAAVQDRIPVSVHNAGLGGAVGVNEPGIGVGFVALALLVAVTQRGLQILQRRDGLGVALQLALSLVVGGTFGSLTVR